MNRAHSMESFLLNMATVLKENSERFIPYEELYKLIYLNLTKRGASDLSTDISLDENNAFARLKNYFDGSRNIKSYIDSTNGFMQFQNRPEEHYGNMESIKLYLPQKIEYLERSARELFDYLNQANISHISRIFSKERNNNLIVQLNNWNDVNKVLNFAKGNKIIKYGALTCNPFMYSEDNIGLSTCRDNSYDSVVACLISSYLNNRQLTDKLNDVSLLDFVKYTCEYYNHHFVDYNDIGEVVSDFNLSGCEVSSIENNKKIVNVGNIVNLFIRGLDPNFNLDGFKDIYYDYSNNGKLIGMANSLGIKRNSNDMLTGSNYVGSIDTILLDAVKTFSDKYHIDEEQSLKIINNYLLDGNLNKITRDNNIRQKMAKSDFANKIKKLLLISNQSLEGYYNLKKQSRSIRVLRDALYETYNKYENKYLIDPEAAGMDGIECAQHALKELILNKNSLGFTRNNNARANLLKYGDIDIAIDEVENAVGLNLDLKDEDMLDRLCGDYVKMVINDKLGIGEKEGTKLR